MISLLIRTKEEPCWIVNLILMQRSLSIKGIKAYVDIDESDQGSTLVLLCFHFDMCRTWDDVAFLVVGWD